jgi:hypothetical protein
MPDNEEKEMWKTEAIEGKGLPTNMPSVLDILCVSD